MRWGNPYLLLFLILIPLFITAVGLARQRRKKIFRKFAEIRFFDYYFQSFSGFHWSIRSIILTGVYFMLVVAAARPQWDKEVQIVKKEGIDIVVCLDVSKSMDAQDIKPSRLQRAKDHISLFIDELRGDRIALVAFAGRSYVQCPLTDDYGAARLFLSMMDTETVPDYGTDIGGALAKAISLFQDKDKYKVIIVASDGEDLEESALKVAAEIAKEGGRVYTLGIGSPEGSTIPVRDKSGNIEYAKDSDGNIVFTRLDVNTLAAIARETDGKFYPITPRQSEIYEILQNINAIEKKKFDSREFIRYKDQYRYFVLAALFLILVELVFPSRRKIKRSRAA